MFLQVLSPLLLVCVVQSIYASGQLQYLLQDNPIAHYAGNIVSSFCHGAIGHSDTGAEPHSREGKAMTSAPKDVISAPSCTLSPAPPVIPTDVPTAAPYYLNGSIKAYYPVNASLKTPNDGYKALTGTRFKTMAIGNCDSAANSYKQAASTCAAICNSNPDCLLFNVITMMESDVNSGYPSWVCRIGKDHKLFNSTVEAEDFTQTGLHYSQVWDRTVPQDATNSSCIFDTHSAHQDCCLWNSYSMPEYISNMVDIYQVHADKDVPQFYRNFLAQVGGLPNVHCEL